MGSSIRFYRRVRIFPGLSVNLSWSGPSLSFGMRGAHVTVGRSGITKTVGIPGTGIYYTSYSGYHAGIHSAHREQAALPNQIMLRPLRQLADIGLFGADRSLPDTRFGR
jgi:hypothetical protein